MIGKASFRNSKVGTSDSKVGTSDFTARKKAYGNK